MKVIVGILLILLIVIMIVLLSMVSYLLWDEFCEVREENRQKGASDDKRQNQCAD